LHLSSYKPFTVSTLLLLFAVPSLAQTQQTAPSSNKSPHHVSSHSRHHKAKRGAWKHHGQQGIAADRAREIQEALIREKYLDGAPSGKWDARTSEAMSRYQAANGWQNKVTPDSRALIKLGLGPNHTQSDLQNPTSPITAGTSSPAGSGASTSAANKQ